MLVNYEITTDLSINSLMDLKKLKMFEEESKLKVNKSRLARELNVDRRTVSKYINGYTKPKTRRSESKIDKYYNLISELLNHPNKVFEYKRILWQYLTDNHGLKCAQSSFRRYISSKDEFQSYFDNLKSRGTKDPSPMRFETGEGQQAQLDWKESINFVLNDGEVIIINIFSFILSYSRFRVYRLSLSKSQDILFNFLDESFKIFGGVPQEIITDNMKTVMDISRTKYSKGKINNKFKQFADDYGFKVRPCIAGRPETKSKVESPMRILDEIKAYSGDLNYDQLVKLLQKINDRENNRYHNEYNMIPIMGFNKEKDFLLSLPKDQIRNLYQIKTTTVKVNKSSMISYKGNKYSVPPKYINQQLKLQIYDSKLHLYSSTELVTIHNVSEKRLNYLEQHYIEVARRTLPFDDDKIEKIAKENLNRIGDRYK